VRQREERDERVLEDERTRERNVKKNEGERGFTAYL